MILWKRVLLSSIAVELRGGDNVSVYFGRTLVRLIVDYISVYEARERAENLPETVGRELARRVNEHGSNVQ